MIRPGEGFILAKPSFILETLCKSRKTGIIQKEWLTNKFYECLSIYVKVHHSLRHLPAKPVTIRATIKSLAKHGSIMLLKF